MPVLLGSNMELGPGMAASMHFTASTAHLAYASDLAVGLNVHEYDLVEDVWQREGMTRRVPDGPGLGVTPRAEFRAEFAP